MEKNRWLLKILMKEFLSMGISKEKKEFKEILDEVLLLENLKIL